ncbi:UDP-Glycosyltransferase/glycogen phosphorylase [Cristinia sonorae]|uniref:UDP-Glycosyltransferase/glycogen phosphorylase n=1 Tax=Cristinia sonorae TaxID=1940300 RepID=A0A8K0UTL4_9AGAR|nr:UDP-Glycosyltransferase/glycogen phosphorylase [Cristinia sonorae]
MRPLCALATRVVLARDVHITFITPLRMHKRVVSELSRGFNEAEVERRELIRVVALDTVVEGLTSGDFIEVAKAEMDRYVQVFTVAYDRLLTGKPITCHATKQEFPAVAVPNIVVIDTFMGQLLPLIKKSNKQTQVVAFSSGMAAFQYLLYAPATRGGRGDFKAKILQKASETDRPVLEVADEWAHTFTDEIIQIPGLPRMYHWELDPQETSSMTKGFMGGLWLSLLETMNTCDGVILTTPEVYEQPAVSAFKEWFRETNRSVWALGPLLPSISSKEAIAGEESLSASSAQITKFMDEALASNGKHSVLYKLESFIEVLIEKRIPFVFSHASPMAKLTDSIKDKVEQSGLGILTRWSPQQTLLSHPALGWFVTHSGQNSALEAISAGVPMICWPFSSDQPSNAVLLTEVHDVAYELLEVRAGNGLKPIYRTGKAPINTIDALKSEAREVLDNAFGDDGARKRKNVLVLKEKFAHAWEKDGLARLDFERFLKTL